MERNTGKEHLPELNFPSSHFQKAGNAFRLMNRAIGLCGYYKLYDEMEFLNVIFRQMARTNGRFILMSFVLNCPA
jgi:hypothetical protein